MSEAIAITMGVNAAAMVDLTDKASEALRIKHFDIESAAGESTGDGR